MSKLWLCLLLLLLLAACGPLENTPPTLTPTRAFSAPTLQPTATLNLRPPTLPPEDIPQAGQSNPAVAGLPIDSELPPFTVGEGTTVLIPSEAGVTLPGDLYRVPTPANAELVPRVPGVMLIGAAREEWGQFPVFLQEAGYAVLVMTANVTTTREFSVALNAFSETPGVNPGVLAVVGAGDLALLGCSLEALCDAVVLLSPSDSPELVNALPGYNPRPLLAVYSLRDTQAVTGADALQIGLTGPFEEAAYDVQGRGAALLFAQAELSGVIMDWLGRHLPG